MDNLVKFVDYLEQLNKSDNPIDRKICKDFLKDLGTTAKALYLANLKLHKDNPTEETERSLNKSKESLLILKRVYEDYDIYTAERVKTEQPNFDEVEQALKVIEDFGF